MNTEKFIAKRVESSHEVGFTRVIVKISIAALALSIAVMIIASSVVLGFKNQVTEKVFGFWGHIHITDNQISRSFEQVPFSINEAYYEQLPNIEYLSYEKQVEVLGSPVEGKYESVNTKGGVDFIQSYANAPGILNTGDAWEAIVVKGVSSDYNWEHFSQFITEGTAISTSEDITSSGMLISTTTARRLQLKLGDKFIIHFIHDGDTFKRRFELTGIYNTGLAEYDKRIVIADIRKIRQFLKWEDDQVGGVEIFIDDLDDLDVLTEYIYQNELPINLYAQTIREKSPEIFEWLSLISINEYVVLGLMLAVCLINMITVLLILILDRIKMIGILKSIGAKNWMIRKIFFYKALNILWKGLLFGTAIGVGLCLLQKYTGLVKLDEANYYLAVAPVELNVWRIVLVNIAATFLIMLFAILPTWLVTKISPSKVLRFD